MQTQQWTFMDKTSWPRGEWDSEPDKLQWTDEATGLLCLVHRGPSGALCGYVGLPEGHRFHGVDYDHVRFDENEDDPYPAAHGGLTFASSCQGSDPVTGRGVCHIPDEGEPDSVWWLGFDCAHCGDYCPAYDRGEGRGGVTYRDLAYVQWQCRQLAAQLKVA